MALPRYRAVLSGVRTHVAWSLRQGLRTRPVAPPSQQRSNVEVGAQVGRDATALEKFRRPERGAPVSYRYSFEDLLALLHGHAPAKVDAVALHRRRVEHGHLSVGLKIHCLGDGSQFSTLVEGLGGAQKILDVNYYKHSHASLCLVLPPVGSARSAILLLECIEHFIGSALFSNPEIQIQVCSPGRLGARRSRERPPADPTLLIGPTSAFDTGDKGTCRPSFI